MIILYELKLIAYNNIRLETWIIIISAFMFLWLGTITVILSKDINKIPKSKTANREKLFSVITDNEKLIMLIIIIFTIIGSISAYYHWKELIERFGSVTNALIQSSIIYRLRVEGKISTGIPYLFGFVHASLVLGGIYSALKGKVSLFLLLPFIVLAIKSLAEVARAGMLLGIIEFSVSYLLFNQYIKSLEIRKVKVKIRNTIIGTIIVLSLFIGTIVIVKFFRAPVDNYKASTRTLQEWKGGVIFSPTIYMYLSSDIGILDAYLVDENEKNSFGQQTFFPLYRLLSKFSTVDKPSYYQKGYFIPIWSNTGTYLRDLLADFGYVGVFLFPFLLGLAITFFWYRFLINGSMISFIITIYLYIIIALSFLNIATRLGNWLIGFVILLVIVYVLRNNFKFKPYFANDKFSLNSTLSN